MEGRNCSLRRHQNLKSNGNAWNAADGCLHPPRPCAFLCYDCILFCSSMRLCV